MDINCTDRCVHQRDGKCVLDYVSGVGEMRFGDVRDFEGRSVCLNFFEG